MPIRFRCAYCNQLMGIARRKAGTVVRCPSCSGQLVVPYPQGEAPPEPEPGAGPFVFERSDFDDLFDSATAADHSRGMGTNPPGPSAAPALPLPPSPVGKAGSNEPARHAAPVGMTPPLQGLPELPGILITPGMATGLSVAIIVAVAVAFAAGFLVGYLLRT